MKRLLVISLTLAAALLGGCVVTPAYRYSGGHAGYYYGYGSSAVYADGYAYPYYGYDGYYGRPWVPYAGASVYYYDRDGYRHDGYRHAQGHRRGRLATSVRDQYGPHSYNNPRRLSQPRPAVRSQRQRSNPPRDRNWHRDRHHRD